MTIKTARPVQDTGAQTKGALTRAAILDVSLELASGKGLEGLTIGTIAERMRMSKSGIFAHFGSREELQVEVVREYFRRFEASVFQPALQEPRGLPRLQCMLDLWMQSRIRELNSGCIFISGAVEFDDCPGAVRDELVNSVQIWRAALARAVQAEAVRRAAAGAVHPAAGDPAGCGTAAGSRAGHPAERHGA